MKLMNSKLPLRNVTIDFLNYEPYTCSFILIRNLPFVYLAYKPFVTLLVSLSPHPSRLPFCVRREKREKLERHGSRDDDREATDNGNEERQIGIKTNGGNRNEGNDNQREKEKTTRIQSDINEERNIHKRKKLRRKRE